MSRSSLISLSDQNDVAPPTSRHMLALIPSSTQTNAIAHNKIMVIDNAVVIAESFNFTTAAEERNAENLRIIPSS
jgi:phosphatidylserine/phosphatidylglycerophosphate/cardiolipin synthase-like enzyme